MPKLIAIWRRIAACFNPANRDIKRWQARDMREMRNSINEEQ